MMNRQLYPFKFIPIASRRVWGGNALIKTLGKSFVESGENGDEVALTESDLIGESWELADMGEQDSVVSGGWLAGNTIGEIMETYLDRISGESAYSWFGRQFPLLIKFLDIHQKLSVQVHPDDEVAAQRYDSLGKAEIWYIIEAKPDAKIYMGFRKPTSAQEFYDACKAGTAQELLNVIHPKAGDAIFIRPGTVHAAEGGILVAEVQESSDMTFRLYDWGRENNPATARKMHLEEAIDLINYDRYDPSDYMPAGSVKSDDGVEFPLVQCSQFSVSRLDLKAALRISPEHYGSYIIYICLNGAAAINVPKVPVEDDSKAVAAFGTPAMDIYPVRKGETVLVPADMPDFYLVPTLPGTELLVASDGVRVDEDLYINPDAAPELSEE
ncbi:MAG: type I phosphomannose isomerase catalytic subunit [Candidatus Cryptobacteroides sp.]